MKKLAMLFALLVATPAGATPDARPVPEGAKAGAEFGYFVGTWKCKESWMKSPISEAYESTSTLIATSVTDGVWVAWSYVQDPSPKNPQPPKGNDLWGYDPAT